MRLLPAERFALLITLALTVLDAALIAYKGVRIDVFGYAGAISTGAFAVLIGQFYRFKREDVGIALSTTSAGLFILFSLAGSVFNYLLLPIRMPRVDWFFQRTDAALGFDWGLFVGWISNWPLFGQVLRVVYFSSVPQLILVILILGFARKADTLHRFLVTGIVGALIAFCVWALFPSFGASSISSLPETVQAVMPIAVGSAYGAELVRLSIEGAAYISPENVLGLIGFPSFHTVMAMMSLIFLRQFVWLRPPVFAVNALMVPAIIVQGGHHLSDMIAGGLVFALAYFIAGLLMRNITFADDPHAKWVPSAA